ncbi:MAG TPA: hypothetical protein VE755_01635 [Myxococcales bacterium]|nr:hypothetical protein [Myxococcales bacterium]
MSRLIIVSALVFAAPAAALAQARILTFRSVEDPASPPDPAVCAAAPFKANVRIGGTLYAYETRASDGKVVQDAARAIGKATACVRLTDFTFPPGLAQSFLLQLTLHDGVYTALGTCTIVSNKVPRAGLVLAGCNLALIEFPEGVLGGVVTSLSTFNPFRLEGFATGSYWTAQIYDQTAAPGGKTDSGRAMEWIQGGDDDSAK